MSAEIDNYTSVRHALRYWCPDDEILATFIDGRLLDTDCMRVSEHLNFCPRCYELVSETRAVLQMAQRGKEIVQDA